eukprot:TRINITY_DN18979_c0_g1_i1.p1 TRINITY_DN18979_c0_g1~~TRINITY_DN18979_c0_g1_i1.p1  ORF type:complete len:962 (-),score=331.48 TRINITY_DN18979_c0_g1_i1:350-3235(-)
MSAKIEDFEFLKLIGSGAYSKVYLVREKKTHILYSMKLLAKSHILKTCSLERIISEREILSKMEHPFIVKLRYAGQDAQYLFFVFDYYSGGDLFSVVAAQDRYRLPESAVQFYAAEIILALDHLHKNKILFRDLKLENVLVSTDGNLVLTDFGMAKEIQSAMTRADSYVGTPDYMAPEIIMSVGHGIEVDFWALGIMCYQMLVGMMPFQGATPEDLFSKALKLEPRFPSFVSDVAANFVSKLLRKDPRRRLGHLGAAEVKAHPFFKGLNWNAVYQRKVPAPKVNKPTESAAPVKAASKETSEDPFDKFTPYVPGTSRYSQKKHLIRLFRLWRSYCLSASQWQKVLTKDAKVLAPRRGDVVEGEGGMWEAEGAEGITALMKEEITRWPAVAQMFLNKESPLVVKMQDGAIIFEGSTAACQWSIFVPEKAKPLVQGVIACVFDHKNMVTKCEWSGDFSALCSYIHKEKGLARSHSLESEMSEDEHRCRLLKTMIINVPVAADRTPNASFTDKASEADQIKKVDRREAIRRSSCWCTNAIVSSPQNKSLRLEGEDSWVNFVLELNLAFQELVVTVESVDVSEEQISMQWKAEGRHVGDFFDWPGTDKPAAIMFENRHIFNAGSLRPAAAECIVDLRGVTHPTPLNDDEKVILNEGWAAFNDMVPARTAGEEMYKRFFQIDPTAEPLFVRTRKSTQAMMFISIFTGVIDLIHDEAELAIMLESLADRHVRYGVQLTHFHGMHGALNEVLAHHLGDRFTPEFAHVWDKFFNNLVGIMGPAMRRCQLQQSVEVSSAPSATMPKHMSHHGPATPITSSHGQGRMNSVSNNPRPPVARHSAHAKVGSEVSMPPQMAAVMESMGGMPPKMAAAIKEMGGIPPKMLEALQEMGGMMGGMPPKMMEAIQQMNAAQQQQPQQEEAGALPPTGQVRPAGHPGQPSSRPGMFRKPTIPLSVELNLSPGEEDEDEA